MKFRVFEAKIEDLGVFNLNDVRKLDSDFHRSQLSDWQKRDWIRSVAGGYYVLSGQEVDGDFLYRMANKVYEPSYISLESALDFWGIVPETVLGVTSVSSRKTKRLQTVWGDLSYRKIKPELLTGYDVIEGKGEVRYKMARPEKAILDYLYLNSKVNSVEDFEGLRWNREKLEEVLRGGEFNKLVGLFENQALRERIDQLVRYVHA